MSADVVPFRRRAGAPRLDVVSVVADQDGPGTWSVMYLPARSTLATHEGAFLDHEGAHAFACRLAAERGALYADDTTGGAA